jgi:L-methionine (R)-S-oxide reductase
MKEEMYRLLTNQARSLLADEDDFIAAMANFSALLYESIPHLNWLGFYIHKNDQLVLGPFQGKIACRRIPWGKGVCGTAARNNQTLRVANVHEFSGHIACDSASRSEMVIPICDDNQVIAILDVDSPLLDRFDADDERGFESLVRMFEKGEYLPSLKRYLSL